MRTYELKKKLHVLLKQLELRLEANFALFLVVCAIY